MALYRRYEDPYKLQQQLKALKESQAEYPDDESIMQDIAELEERINFAWQDDEAAVNGWE